MSNGRYKIVLEDRVLDGHTVDTVKQNLCRFLKVDPGRIERLFAGSPTVIKKDIDYPTACKYKAAL